jgi:hypothetical protein
MSLTSNELPDWKQLVLNRKEQLGSLQKVADELGYSRTSLSLALRDKYIGSTARLVKKVLAVLGKIECPYLKHEISSIDCQKYKERDAPTQNPAEMRHWRACQSCPIGCGQIKKKE